MEQKEHIVHTKVKQENFTDFKGLSLNEIVKKVVRAAKRSYDFHGTVHEFDEEFRTAAMNAFKMLFEVSKEYNCPELAILSTDAWERTRKSNKVPWAVVAEWKAVEQWFENNSFEIDKSKIIS